MTRIALVGMDSFFFTTSIAQTLAGLDSAELVACCDLGVSAEECAANAGKEPSEIAEEHGVPLYDDPASMRDAVELDGAVVATHPGRAPETVAALVETGLPLYIVKPAALDGSGIETLRRSCLDSNLPIVTGMSYRLHPGVQAVHEALRDGRIGRLASFRAMHQHGHLSAWAPQSWYRTDPRIHPALFLGWYVTDLFRWFAGEGPSEIATFGSRLSDPDSPHEDTIRALYRTDSGIVAALDVYFGVRWPYPDLELEILGTEGAIRFHGSEGGAIVRADGTTPIPATSVDLLRAELESWVRAVRGEAEPWHRPDEWIAALEDAVRWAEAFTERS